MNMHTPAEFFVSTWIWGMTFDLSHVIVVTLIMFLLFRFLWTKGLITAALAAVLLSAIAFGVHTVIAFNVTSYVFDWQNPDTQPYAITTEHALIMCMALAGLYATIQTLLIFCWRLLKRFRVLPYIVIIWISNGFAGLISYIGMRIFMWYSF